ncbi:UvrD-helicase domain-containing protein, partial [Staphylococcus epidermidis]|uniref:UvrD-helicase domain-containing protein n=1 Tax=Staphylococcus epidermidis TaxID=1282 RepID=UPI0037DA680C
MTFTNKPPKQINPPLQHLLPQQPQLISISTFHSISLTILTTHPHPIPIQTNFTIIHPTHQKSLIKHLFKTQNIHTNPFDPRIFI